MSENRTTRRKGRRRLLIGIAAGVVVLIVAAFMVVDFAINAGRQPVAAPPATPAPSGTAMAGITVGSGGTRTGADAVTKIGYAGTCDGAVQAATNYKKGLDDVLLVNDAKKIAFINQVVLPGTTKDSLLDDANRRLNVLKTDEGRAATKGFTQTTHVEWGGAYKVSDCTSERTAVVQILGCLATTFDSKSEKPVVSCGSDIVRLLWSGGDWKVVSLGAWGPARYQLNITDSIPGWKPSPEQLPMPASIRDAYLLNVVTGAKDGGVG